MECHAYFDHIYTGHSTHFQVGGDDSKVEGGVFQNQYVKQSHILLVLSL